MAETLDLAYIKRSHGERTRQGRCRDCRGDFPCQSLLAAQEIERLESVNLNIREVSGVLRSAWGQEHEARLAAEHQLHEAQQALAQLMGTPQPSLVERFVALAEPLAAVPAESEREP